MSHGVKKPTIHWLSLLLFSLSGFCCVALWHTPLWGTAIQALGFLLMGYASLRAAPADFFTQKLSRCSLPDALSNQRAIDKLMQIIGLVCICLGTTMNGLQSP
ncbi:hypothetical protein GCM10011369_29010 [Neiella marina]|uniref:Uncharacterized protein n=1 Tax=Neiella marina TaxID=508461 RepID=A0A8J2XR15_9GAMM|nr:hypothetical protein [Neiella marina]GGA85161.1 hypothetical protein GCM10011369_29010 [Neiella marina]